MSNAKSAATKMVSAFVTLAVVVGAVTVGGVAQTDSGNSDASVEDAEPNDSMANATPIEYGEEVDANLSSPDDVDYYAVDATAGDGLVPRLHLKNMFGGSAIEVDVVTPSGEVSTEMTGDQMYGPKNVAGEARPMGARDAAFTGDVMESNGTYYVRVSEAEEIVDVGGGTNESDTYRYNLTVTTEELDEYDPNENGTTATPIDVGETVDAAFAGYDSDVYAVNLTANRTYDVSLAGGDDDFPKRVLVYDRASPAVDDPDYGDDYDSNGTPVLAGDSILEDGNVTFTPEQNGTYYVQIVQDGINNNLLGPNSHSVTVRESGASPPDGGDDADSLPDEGDVDGDGLSNGRELDVGTDPRAADTDGDDLSDGCELKHDTDPTDPDTDDDGTSDGVEV